MNKIQIALESPATYAAAALFLVNVIPGVVSLLHGTPLIIADVILAAATAYLTASHVQSAALTGSVKFGAVVSRQSGL